MNNPMNETRLSELLRNLPAPQRLDPARRQKIRDALPPEKRDRNVGDTGAVAESPNRQLPALCHNARRNAAASQRDTHRFFFPKLRAVAAVLVGIAALTMLSIGVYNELTPKRLASRRIMSDDAGQLVGRSQALESRIVKVATEIEESEEAMNGGILFGTTAPAGAFMPAEERVGAFRNEAPRDGFFRLDSPTPITMPMSVEDVSGKLARDAQNEMSRRSNISGDAEIAKFKTRADKPFSPKPAEMSNVEIVKSPVVMRGMSASRTGGVESKKLQEEVAASTTPRYASGDVVVELDGEPIGGSGFALGGGPATVAANRSPARGTVARGDAPPAPATPASSLGITDGSDSSAALSAGITMLAGRTVADTVAESALCSVGSVSPVAENSVRRADATGLTEPTLHKADVAAPAIVASSAPVTRRKLSREEPVGNDDIVLGASLVVAPDAPESASRPLLTSGSISHGFDVPAALAASESDARELVAAESIDGTDYYHTTVGQKRSEKSERVAESQSRSRRAADSGRDALDSDSSGFVAGTVVLGEPAFLGKALAEEFKSESRKSNAIHPARESAEEFEQRTDLLTSGLFSAADLANRLKPLEIVSVTEALRQEIGGDAPVDENGRWYISAGIGLLNSVSDDILEEAVEDEPPAQLADMSELRDEWADEDRDEAKKQSGIAAGDSATRRVYQPFALVDAAQQPLSTFGLDVDTAGYTRSKMLVDAGVRPEPDAVRQEEFINAFDYDDTAPGNAGTTFRVFLEGARSPFRPEHRLLRVGIKGRRLGREEQRPLVLTILLDSSGSMDTPERMALARFAIEELTKKLSDRDTLTILTCSDAVRQVVTTQRGLENPATRARVAESLREVQCRGATNLEAGIDAAFRFAADTFVPGAENRVVVISDGIANLGSDNPDEILGRISAYRTRGVRCSVIGVGRSTYNDKLLEAVANRGDGQYKFLDSREAVQTNFTDDLAASFNTIAADVKIQIEWNTNAVAAYRSHGYDSRALTKEQFRDDAVKAGEVGSGQGVSVIFEMKLRDGIARDATLGTVHIRYRRTDTGAVEEIARPITADMVAGQFGATRPQFRLACCVAESATILRTLPPAAQKDALRNVLVIAQGIALELDFYKPAAEFAEMLQKLISMGL